MSQRIIKWMSARRKQHVLAAALAGERAPQPAKLDTDLDDPRPRPRETRSMATGPAERRCGGTSRQQVGRERSPPAPTATVAAPTAASSSASTLPSSPEGAAPTSRNTPRPQQQTGGSHRISLDAVIPAAQHTSVGAPYLIPGRSCHLLRTILSMLNRHEWCADHLRTPSITLVKYGRYP